MNDLKGEIKNGLKQQHNNYRDILEANRIIKNYLILCFLFGWKPTKGKGRKYQFAELSRYCVYHMEGQKIFIDKIYDEPLEKIDDRSYGNHTKYGHIFDNLIIDTLIDYGGAIEDSFSLLMIVYLQLFNKEYEDLFKYDFARKNNVTRGLIEQYTTYVWSTVNQLFITSLNRLQKHGIIMWEQNYFIKEGSREFISDEKMTNKIKELDKEACNLYNIHPLQKGVDKNRNKIKKYVLSKLGNPNIWSYHKVYYIELLDEDIEPDEYDIDDLKILLRKSITKKIMKHKFKVKPEGSDTEKIVTPYNNLTQQIKVNHIHNIIFGEVIDFSDPFADVEEKVENIPWN